MEGLDKMNKAELIAKLEEMASTEVGEAIAARDKAYAMQAEASAKVTTLEAQLANGISADDKAELERQVQDLSERLAANEATKGDDRPVVKANGEQVLIVPRQLLVDGEVLTAEQLANRQDILDRLHKEKSGALKSISSILASKA
jgi:hypothetical protein